jgi:hypothetical protein
MNVALACIAKNETLYIEEWIQYHLYLGFDKVFVYQNDWRLQLDSPLVEKIEFDGGGRQTEAYNNFLSTYYNDYEWVAFFDVDEFLVLKQHDSVKSFLNRYNEFDGVAINWYLFGDNNQPSPTNNYSVLSRFTKRSKKIDKHIKCIVKTNIDSKYNIHSPVRGNIVDCNKNMVIGDFNERGDDSIAQINHYFTKTRDEWKLKKERGRASAKNAMRLDGDFDLHNKNEVEDLTALNFFVKKSNIF